MSKNGLGEKGALYLYVAIYIQNIMIVSIKVQPYYKIIISE